MQTGISKALTVILAVVLYMALLILVPPGRTSLSLYLSVQILPIRHVRHSSSDRVPGKPVLGNLAS